jgi:hypothetical protein
MCLCPYWWYTGLYMCGYTWAHTPQAARAHLDFVKLGSIVKTAVLPFAGGSTGLRVGRGLCTSRQ